MAEAKNKMVGFVSDLGRFNNIVQNWKGERRRCAICMVVKVQSVEKERIGLSSLGREIHYVYDPYRYAMLSKKLKEKDSYEIDGFTFFRNFNGHALSKLQRYSETQPS